jgi:DNA-binding LacI/PurR family transcriptional regulator
MPEIPGEEVRVAERGTQRPGRRRATSADVARESGVSRATVSYVLNRTPGHSIPEETRKRVLDAARRLDYVPSASARALRSGRTDIVLLAMPNLPQGPVLSAFVHELAGGLALGGLTLVTHLDDRSHSKLSDVVQALSPIAVISYPQLPEKPNRQLVRSGVRWVTGVNLSMAGLGVDDRGWARLPGRLQAEHLLARGHRRLGFARPEDPTLAQIAEDRLDGVRAACAAAGAAAPQVLTVPFEADRAAGAVADWRRRRTTGVCCYNDDVALAVLAGARKCGVPVPAELAVMGVDDIPLAALANPPLTTVNSPSDRVGASLAAQLLALVRGETPPTPERPMEMTVVVRESA